MDKVKIFEVFHEGRAFLFEEILELADYLATIDEVDDCSDVSITTKIIERQKFEKFPLANLG